MNIFLLCPSLYRPGLPIRAYSSGIFPEWQVSCRHTNIPVFSALTHQLAAQGQQIDRVIMLASKECREEKETELGVRSTIDYIKANFDDAVRAARAQNAQPIAYSVITMDAANADTARIQSAIDRELGDLNLQNASVWVDFTSGLRTQAILLIFLLRYWETQMHASIRNIFYANISGEAGMIDSCMAVYNMFNYYTRLDTICPASAVTQRIEQKPEKMTDRRTDAEKMQAELTSLISSLKKDLCNASGDKRERLTKVRNQVQKLMDEATDPMTRRLAENILETLPAGRVDRLSQVEYMIGQNLISPAMVHLREIAFEFLVSEGVIRLNGKQTAGNVEVEVVTARFYYETFVSFMLELLRELERGGEALDPMQVLRQRLDDALRERHEQQEYLRYKAKAQINESIRKTYQEVCCKAIRFEEEAFFEEAKQAMDNGSKALLAVVSRYQTKKEQYEQIFMQSGFPLACIDYQKHKYQYDFYRTNLTSRAQLLMGTLNDARTGRNTGMVQSLRKNLPQNAGYAQVLAYCREHLTSIIKQPYSFMDPSANCRWTCGLSDHKQLYSFFNTYMPLHDDLRKLRNNYAHAKSMTEEMTTDENEALVRRCIAMLRELSLKKTGQEQG